MHGVLNFAIGGVKDEGNVHRQSPARLSSPQQYKIWFSFLFKLRIFGLPSYEFVIEGNGSLGFYLAHMGWRGRIVL